MLRLVVSGVFVVAMALAVVAQSAPKERPTLNRIELLSPWNPEGTRTLPERRDRNCFDLIRLLQRCGGGESLHYGNRSGINWDIFAVSGGRDSQTRMIGLGAHDWNDRFSIPEVEPWPALKEGETRTIIVNTSGVDGKDGEPGRPGKPGANADGTVTVEPPRATPSAPKRAKQTIDYGKSPLSVQVSSTINVKGKAPVASSYNPFTDAKKGHMYLIRVVNRESDDYILLRVDDLVRGEKASISYFRFPAAL
jgi:hypothetical protein